MNTIKTDLLKAIDSNQALTNELNQYTNAQILEYMYLNFNDYDPEELTFEISKSLFTDLFSIPLDEIITEENQNRLFELIKKVLKELKEI